MLARHVLGDQGDDLDVDLELVETDRGHVVLLGQKLGQLPFLQDAEFRQAVRETTPRGALVGLSLSKLFGRDQLFADKELTDTIGRHTKQWSRSRDVREMSL